MLKRQETKAGARYDDFTRTVFLRVGRTIQVSWDLTAGSIRALPSRLSALRHGRLTMNYHLHVFQGALGYEKSAGWLELAAGPSQGTGAIAIDPKRGSVHWLAPLHLRDGHMARLGTSSQAFLEAWVGLGCVGPDFAHLRPFLDKTGLSCSNAAALQWRAWFGFR